MNVDAGLAGCRRVLVTRLSSLGDVVRITGCVAALREACPRAEIVVATGRPWAAVFSGDPAVDRLLLAPEPRPRLRFVADAIRQLAPFRRQGGFDLAVDLQGSGPSAVWTYASRARIQAGRGRRRPGWSFSVEPDLSVRDVAESAAILGRLGLQGARTAPRLVTSATAEATLSDRLIRSGLPASGFLVVSPFTRWPAKAWPVGRYARLLPRLVEAGLGPIVVSGDLAQAPAASSLVSSMEAGGATSLAGELGLDELFCLLRRARLVLTSDSGPMHAAAAVGTRVVALFGPTWPERAGPEGEGHTTLQRRRLPDYHAYLDARNVTAMEALGVDEVFDAIRSAWEYSGERGRS